MSIVKANNLACPIDGDRLRQLDRQLLCDNRHTYDIARQGYVNLLPVQYKRSKQPGDSKAMVVARTQFLNTGIYQPVAKKMTGLLASLISDGACFDDMNSDDVVSKGREICLLDAGCGEGYYFDEVFDFLKQQDGENNFSFIGLDISKEAIIQATKRNRQISWVVGTNRQPPVADNSVDIILCMFGFLSIEGFSRVLKPGGKIILVDPGENHLKELRAIIYPEVKKTDQSDVAQMDIAGFAALSSENLQFKVNISSNEQVNNLLVMTPHFYRASKEGREVACALQALVITVDVVFRVFEKL